MQSRQKLGAALVAGLLSVFAQAASAQELRHGIADHAAIDVLGVQIGMSSDEALAVLQQHFPDIRPTINTRGHPGTKKQFVSTVALRTPRYPKEEIYLHFAGFWSGNRLYALKRRVQYQRGENPSFTETLANLTGKYGVPSHGAINNTTRLDYAFTPELIHVQPEAEVAGILDRQEEISAMAMLRAPEDVQERSKITRRCMEAVPKIQNPQFFDVLKARGELPGCSAGMAISLGRSGDNLTSMEISISDFQLVLDAAAYDREQNDANTPQRVPTGAASKL